MVDKLIHSIIPISVIFLSGILALVHVPAHAACRCCDLDPEVLSLETDVGVGVCGEIRNFRCEGDDPQFTSHACVNSSNCDLGPCLITPPYCQQDRSITCSQDSDCAGVCVEQTTLGFPHALECGRLYTGGGLNWVPLPLLLPDMQEHFFRVTNCPRRGLIELGPTTRASVGDHHCTEGRKCSAGSDQQNDPCSVDGDCANGTCEDRCFFGPPLPIPNAETVPVSHCVIRTVAADASGTAECLGGAVSVDLPLRWSVHVTGDLLNRWQPPEVPGVQPCPLCTRVCEGGGNAGFPCVADGDCESTVCSGSEECLGGPNDGNPCTPHTSRLDVHNCCAGGMNHTERCETHADCAPPPGAAPRCELTFAPCLEDSDCTTIPNDRCIRCVSGCTSFPTSHDCPPAWWNDITLRIGGLPIDFSLTTGSITKNATDLGVGERVFCGYCRDVSGVSSLCFEGNTDNGCPPAIPEASGHAVACTSDADCQVDADEYETCSQRNPGAFSEVEATEISVTGWTDGQCMEDGLSHDANLVSFYCSPPTFDATIDNSGYLPGPSVALMRAGMTFRPAVCGNGVLGGEETCDDGNTLRTDGCGGTCQIEPCSTCAGEPSTCSPITSCENEDGCCPEGCDLVNDDDCPRAVKCKDAKAKAAGKKAADLLKAFGKNEKRPDAEKLIQNISKAQSKFTRRYLAQEDKGGCQTVDDSATIEAKVDAFVSEVLNEICPP